MLVSRRVLRRAVGQNLDPITLWQLSGMRAAAITFALEALKSALPTLIGYTTLGIQGAVAGGTAALVGHNFSVFLRGRGSKGISATVGVLLVIYPLVVVILGMVWIAALSAWRYTSLAALVVAAVMPLALAALDVGGGHENSVVIGAVIWALLIFIQHRDNIRRLMSGQEARFGAPLQGRRFK